MLFRSQRGLGVLEFWSFGVSEFRSFGVLEFWSFGSPEGAGVERCRRGTGALPRHRRRRHISISATFSRAVSSSTPMRVTVATYPGISRRSFHFRTCASALSRVVNTPWNWFCVWTVPYGALNNTAYMIRECVLEVALGTREDISYFSGIHAPRGM